MKKSVLNSLATLLSLVFLGTSFVSPAHASDSTVACSVSGTFTIVGTTVTRSSQDCTGDITIPSDVTLIREFAFSNRSISSLAFAPNSQLREVGTAAFENANIPSPNLPHGLKSIDFWAFKGTTFTSISIPGTVELIGAEAFRSTNLETVNFEARETSTLTVGEDPFLRSAQLSSITFAGPGALPNLGATVDKPNLNYVGWSDSLGGTPVSFPVSVADGSSVTLYPTWVPPVVTTYNCSASGTFTTTDHIVTSSTGDCAGEITVPAHVQEIRGAFSGRNLTAVHFEANSQLTTIDEYAFEFTNLSSINLPTGLQSIGHGAFTDTKFTSVSIPGTVESISGGAFASAANLESVVFEPRIAASLYIGVFQNNPMLTSVTFQGTTTLGEEPFQIANACNHWDGWSTTPSGSVTSFPQTATNLTLFANLSTTRFSATYDSSGGSEVAAGAIVGCEIQFPTSPTRPGYTFAFWSEWIDGVPITRWTQNRDVTFYANWTPNTYAINFNSKSGSIVPAGSYITGGQLETAPDAPTRAGYTFVGWSATDGGNLLEFPYTPGWIEDITLYAIWTRNPYKPERLSNPVVSGSGMQGALLSTQAGTWSAFPEEALTYQWFRCENAVPAGLEHPNNGSNCILLVGSRDSNYRPVLADAGKYLTVLEKASNSIGDTFATAESIHAPALQAPSKIDLPLITGTAVAGSYLSAGTGSWSGNPAPETSIQWYRCKKLTKASSGAIPKSSKCTAIKKGNNALYKLGAADKGQYVTAQITAKNVKGKALTKSTSLHVALEPTKKGNPAISGSPSVSKTLRVTSGRWLAFPNPTTSVRWYRCTKATAAGSKKLGVSSGCVAISGATTSSYTLTSDDRGKYLTALITAANTAGSTSVTAKSTKKVS